MQNYQKMYGGRFYYHKRCMEWTLRKNDITLWSWIFREMKEIYSPLKKFFFFFKSINGVIVAQTGHSTVMIREDSCFYVQHKAHSCDPYTKGTQKFSSIKSHFHVYGQFPKNHSSEMSSQQSAQDPTKLRRQWWEWSGWNPSTEGSIRKGCPLQREQNRSRWDTRQDPRAGMQSQNMRWLRTPWIPASAGLKSSAVVLVRGKGA